MRGNKGGRGAAGKRCDVFIEGTLYARMQKKRAGERGRKSGVEDGRDVYSHDAEADDESKV